MEKVKLEGIPREMIALRRRLCQSWYWHSHSYQQLDRGAGYHPPVGDWYAQDGTADRRRRAY
jgi:hypothetical protein